MNGTLRALEASFVGFPLLSLALLFLAMVANHICGALLASFDGIWEREQLKAGLTKSINILLITFIFIVIGVLLDYVMVDFGGLVSDLQDGGALGALVTQVAALFVLVGDFGGVSVILGVMILSVFAKYFKEALKKYYIIIDYPVKDADIYVGEELERFVDEKNERGDLNE